MDGINFDTVIGQHHSSQDPWGMLAYNPVRECANKEHIYRGMSPQKPSWSTKGLTQILAQLGEQHMRFRFLVDLRVTVYPLHRTF